MYSIYPLQTSIESIISHKRKARIMSQPIIVAADLQTYQWAYSHLPLVLMCFKPFISYTLKNFLHLISIEKCSTHCLIKSPGLMCFLWLSTGHTGLHVLSTGWIITTEIMIAVFNLWYDGKPYLDNHLPTISSCL